MRIMLDASRPDLLVVLSISPMNKARLQLHQEETTIVTGLPEL